MVSIYVNLLEQNKAFTQEKSSTPRGLVWDTNMAALPLFYNTNTIPDNFFWDISVRFLSWECWDFWRWHDHFRRFPKKSEVFRRSPKSSEDVPSLPKTSEVCRSEVFTCFSLQKSEIARKVLSFIHFTQGFRVWARIWSLGDNLSPWLKFWGTFSFLGGQKFAHPSFLAGLLIRLGRKSQISRYF